MARVSGRDLSVQYALEEVEGPQGEDRQDWRAAWLAWWVVRAQGGVKNIDPDVFYEHLRKTLTDAIEKRKPDELITDDPEASEAKAKQLEQQLLELFPRENREA